MSRPCRLQEFEFEFGLRREWWGLIPSILAGGGFAVVFAVLVSVPMFRFHGLYFTIGSLVLASALGIFMVNHNGLGGNDGLTFIDSAPTGTQLYTLAAACAVIAIVGTALVVRRRLGLGLMAVRDDEDVAERMGVATFRTKLASFVLSAFVIGLVGGLQAQKLGHIEPYGSFALSWTQLGDLRLEQPGADLVEQQDAGVRSPAHVRAQGA